MKKYSLIIGISLFSLAVILYLNQSYGWFIISNPSLSETYVSLRFDDGWESQLNACELLKKYGFPGSIYIISGFVGKKPGYMDWPDVKKVSEVMEIGGHTKDHADLRNLRSAQEFEEQIGDDFRILSGKGFNVKTFVYPYGNYSKSAISVVKKYYRGASTQDVGVCTGETNVYLLKDFTIRLFNNLPHIKRTIKPGTWMILTFHDVGEPCPTAPAAVKNNAVSVQLFEEILRWLKESNIKVITVTEGCEMLRKLQEGK